MKDFLLEKFLPVSICIIGMIIAINLFFVGIGWLLMTETNTIHSMHFKNKEWIVLYSIDGRFSKGHVYEEEFEIYHDAELFIESMESK